MSGSLAAISLPESLAWLISYARERPQFRLDALGDAFGISRRLGNGVLHRSTLEETLSAAQSLPFGTRFRLERDRSLWLHTEAWLGLRGSEEERDTEWKDMFQELENYSLPGPEERAAEAEALQDVPGMALSVLEEGGWTYYERDTRLDVNLETDQGPIPAALSATEQGLTIRVSLVTGERDLESPVKQAIALLLLTTGSQFRFVGAWGAERANEYAAGVQATLPRRLMTPPVLHLSLGGLTLACREMSQEVAAISAPELASRYLAIRGWDPSPEPTKNE